MENVQLTHMGTVKELVRMAKIIYSGTVLMPTYQCFRTKEKSVLVITLGSAERAENSGLFFSFEAIGVGFLSKCAGKNPANQMNLDFYYNAY